MTLDLAKLREIASKAEPLDPPTVLALLDRLEKAESVCTLLCCRIFDIPEFPDLSKAIAIWRAARAT